MMQEMITIVPNFCPHCGDIVPDDMMYRRTLVKETPKEVRVAICKKCGNDLFFHKATELRVQPRDDFDMSRICPNCKSRVSGGWMDHQLYCDNCGWSGTNKKSKGDTR